MVRLTRIYTRSGDEGETWLGDRTRIAKTDPRIHATGDIDELNAHIGAVIAAESIRAEHETWLRRIQNDLFDVGADLCVPISEETGKSRFRVTADYVQWLERACDEANAELAPLESFIFPGGSATAAQLHITRAVCRRAERGVLEITDVNPEVVRYLNRLSDLLFILARSAGESSERLWEPGRRSG